MSELLVGVLTPRSTVLEGALSPKVDLRGTITVPTLLFDKDYEHLTNKPRIEHIEVIGDKTFEDYGLVELSGDDLISILTD